MAAKRQREAEEITRNALRELKDPSDFSISREERLKMRNIPFFVLPNYETLPKTHDVKAKVDTHNTSYQPTRPKSAYAITSNTSDYSHIRSKVDTGKRRFSGGSERELAQQNGRHEDGRSSRQHDFLKSRTSVSTPSLHKVKPVNRAFRSASTSQLPGTSTASSKGYQLVKSRVGSLDNIHHKPGGGTKKASPKTSEAVTLTRQTSKVKLAWENSPHTPGGGKTKIVTFQSTHFSAQAKSKVDQKDPNPAHKLGHSLEELTLTHGRKINPRFAEKRDSNKLFRRHSSSDIGRAYAETATAAKAKLRKSVTLGSHLEYPENFISGDFDPHTYKKNMDRAVETSNGNGDILSHFEQNESDLNTGLDLVSDQSSTSQEELERQNGSWKNPTEAIATSSNSEGGSVDSIYDIEVTNSSSETTVLLKHLLAKSSLSKEDSLDVIQESEEEENDYYEPVDEDTTLILIAACTHTFPNGVPKLIVTDENEQIVDIIVDLPESTDSPGGSKSALIEETSEGSQSNLSDLVLNCASDDASYSETGQYSAQEGTSTRL